jgi:MFS family permease
LCIGPVGFYIRRRLPETIEERQTHRSGSAVITELLRHHSRTVVLGVLIICGGTVSTYVFNYMSTFAITTLHLSEAMGTTLTLTGNVANIAGVALGVWMDRFGRKPMLVLSRVIFVLAIFPAYLFMTSSGTTPAVIVGINMLLNFLYSVGLGAMYAFMCEAFPKAVRSSGLAILYALGVTMFGGTTQFVVAWLIDVFKNPLVPAWYQVVANVAGIIGVLLMMPHPEGDTLDKRA